MAYCIAPYGRWTAFSLRSKSAANAGVKSPTIIMTHTQKRKIVVDEIAYEWCIRGDALYAEYATVYRPNVNGTAIHLDIIPWGVEMRPRTIKEVVRFALEHCWNSQHKGQPLKVGYVNECFVILPVGIKNSHEYEIALNKNKLATRKDARQS